MNLTDRIDEYKLSTANLIHNTMLFQNEFLSICQEKYWEDFIIQDENGKKEIKPEDKNLSAKEINRFEKNELLNLFLNYVLTKIYKTLKLNKKKRDLDHLIKRWFKFSYNVPKKASKSGSKPNPKKLLQIALLLNWTIKDYNRLAFALSFQKIDYCGSLEENVYKYALTYNKGYYWAENTIKSLKNKCRENLYFSSEIALTAPIKKMFENMFMKFKKETITSKEEVERDKEFLSKMEKMVCDFVKSSGTLIKLCEVLMKNVKADMFYSLFYMPYSCEKEEILSQGTIRTYFNGIIPKKKHNNSKVNFAHDVERIPSREFLILLSTANYVLTPDLQKESLITYINKNLNGCNFFLLNPDKALDNYIMELSHYKVIEYEKNKVYIYYDSQLVEYIGKISENISLDDFTKMTGLEKCTLQTKILSFIICKYNDKIDIDTENEERLFEKFHPLEKNLRIK